MKRRDIQINQSMGAHEIQALLRSLDIKPTSQRNKIAQVMLEKPQHLSAEQVLSLVNEKGTCVSKATVYNTLNLFVEKKLIRLVNITPTKVFYDSNITLHHHFYNEDTGELSDFDAVDIEMGALPALPDNTRQSGIDIIVRIKDL